MPEKQRIKTVVKKPQKFYALQYIGPEDFSIFTGFMSGQKLSMDKDRNVLWETEDGKLIKLAPGAWCVRRGAIVEAYSEASFNRYFEILEKD